MEQNIVSWREELQASTWGSGGEEDTHTHMHRHFTVQRKKLYNGKKLLCPSQIKDKTIFSLFLSIKRHYTSAL